MSFQKFHITEAQIDVLVAEFYARVRKDPEIGPIFLRAIGSGATEWRHHEARIASFWRNAIGLDRDFSGNPLRKHSENTEIRPEHFAQWLTLFDQAAQDVLPAQAAQSMSVLAHRIGRSLQFGLTQYRSEAGRVPTF